MFSVTPTFILNVLCCFNYTIYMIFVRAKSSYFLNPILSFLKKFLKSKRFFPELRRFSYTVMLVLLKKFVFVK